MPRLDLSVSRVVQSTDWNCWAASLAVMLGRSTDTEIVDELEQRFPNVPDEAWNDGATPIELGWSAQQFGLNQVYPRCQEPDGWEQWLSEYGPLLIQIPGSEYHSVVVAGVEYDSEEEQVSMESKLRIVDPWHSGGGDNWMSFDDANSRYELAGANWQNNVYSR